MSKSKPNLNHASTNANLRPPPTVRFAITLVKPPSLPNPMSSPTNSSSPPVKDASALRGHNQTAPAFSPFSKPFNNQNVSRPVVTTRTHFFHFS